MRLFNCQNCGQILFFENRTCEKCGLRLGYLAETNQLSALKPDGEEWLALAVKGRRFRFCVNAEHDVCNWLVPAESEEKFCPACRHNRTIPDLSRPENTEAWRKLEDAKHRLFYTLLRLKLPLKTRVEDPEHGLAFDFLDDPPATVG